jgi:hypothetical protein
MSSAWLLRECRQYGGDGGRVGWVAVGGGVDLAVEAAEFGGVDVGSAMGLERKAGQGGDAYAGGDQGLHDDHVVAE